LQAWQFLIGAGFGMVTGYIKAIPANALDIITSSSDSQTTNCLRPERKTKLPGFMAMRTE